MALLVCEALFGRTAGGEVRTLVEKLAGGPCPCVQGRACPLMPVEEAAPIVPTSHPLPGC